MRRFVGLLIGVILVIIVGSIFECSGKNKTEKELIKFWGEETVSYFKTLNCNKLQSENYTLEFDKIFIIKGRFGNCELWEKQSWEINFKEFNNSSEISNHITRDIKKTDVIVWIKALQNGETYGNYSNGATAIRLNYEINLIDKKNRTIFKKSIFEGIGKPPDEILRKQSENRSEYFGSIPYSQVIEFLKYELTPLRKVSRLSGTSINQKYKI